jgi:predicted DsbA family dithiol-disulfide isomerase
LQERIFHGYFTDGLYPDIDSLVGMANDVGANDGVGPSPFDGIEVRRVLESNEYEARVLQEAENASKVMRSNGVNGVPFFSFNGRPAFSGAQNPETFIDVFDKL